MIMKPTIGRKVWYYPAGGAPEQDATVIDVHGDRSVTLFVINRGGTTSTQRSVPLVQPGDETPQGAHAKWMPFQVGQAQAITGANTETDHKQPFGQGVAMASGAGEQQQDPAGDKSHD